jgi:hypothetical protein
MWHHVTNHLIISTDKDSNSENQIKLQVRDIDLSLPHPQPLTSPPCSDNSGSTPLHLSHPTASKLLTKPTKCLLFRSPLPKGEGVKQALAWNREQLLDLRRLWELRRQHRVSARLIPMTQPPPMISDSALGVENRINTVTAIPPSSQTPLSTSPLDSQCRPPFQPTVWRDLTSVMCRPWRWQVALSTLSNKMVKIPLQFCHPMTTGSSSLTLSQRVLESPLPSLPKGWVCTVEDVTLVERQSDLDRRVWMQLVGDSAMILGH